MSSVMTSVLNLTFGLLWNKVRDHTANKLKKVDFTDQKCRQEFDDIKTNLDGLARKDLLSSVSFVEEGLCLLIFAIEKATANKEIKEKEDNLKDEALSTSKHVESVDVHEAWSSELSEAIKKLKITSEGGDCFSSAKDSFKAAREKATEAFINEALSIEDRIFATKLRVISRIVESLEEPDVTANECKIYLKELHDVPAVKQMFFVHLNGGIKNLFNKTRRLKNVRSVEECNFIVLIFISKFTKLPPNFPNWPRIELGERTYNPIMENSEFMEGERLQNCNIVEGQQLELKLVKTNGNIAWDASREKKVDNTTISECPLFSTVHVLSDV